MAVLGLIAVLAYIACMGAGIALVGKRGMTWGEWWRS